jgi:hypothetical protein
LAVAIALIGVLLLFFIPLIPATVFQCSGGAATTCLTNNAGLESIGNQIFHWGAFYSYESGYFSPIVSNLTTFGVLLFVVLPFVIASMLLIAPEFRHTSVRLKRR